MTFAEALAAPCVAGVASFLASVLTKSTRGEVLPMGARIHGFGR
jgi:hypothetical protein